MFATVTNSKASLIENSFSVNDVQYPANVTELWSLSELAAISVYPVEDEPVPAGNMVTGYTLEIGSNKVLRHWKLTPIPPQPYTIYKTDIVTRMSDSELEQFDAALTAAPLRQRRMWADCQALESSSEYFGGLTQQFTAAFGADRAKAILAASEG